jgi:hypothetical protein
MYNFCHCFKLIFLKEEEPHSHLQTTYSVVGGQNENL